MTAIAAGLAADLFSRTPPFARAAEALEAIRAQHGRARARIVAVATLMENVKLAVNLLRDLDEAQRSGNPKRLAKVHRRLNRVLASVSANQDG